MVTPKAQGNVSSSQVIILSIMFSSGGKITSKLSSQMKEPNVDDNDIIQQVDNIKC
jgi:hypothetical protein